MNSSPVLYAPLPSAGAAASENGQYPAALWPSAIFVALLGILAIVALTSDFSLTPDQRTEIFQQSGMYP